MKSSLKWMIPPIDVYASMYISARVIYLRYLCSLVKYIDSPKCTVTQHTPHANW